MEHIKKTLSQYIIKSAVILLVMGILGTLLLTLVWCIPEDFLRAHVDGAWAVFKAEGSDQGDIRFFTYTYSSKLIADTDMMKAVIADDPGSAIVNAMDINGYSRYWHGYLVLLRPLITIFTYGQLRYLMAAVFLLQIIYLAAGFREKFGMYVSMAFAISLVAVNIMAVPYSFHVSICMMFAFTAGMIVLKKYDPSKENIKIWSFFLITGAITSYIDFLTTPVLTLALPLLILIMINLQHGENNLKSNFLTCFRNSFAWCIGYALYWAEKWLIGSLILQKNVLADAILKVNNWETTGDGVGTESFGRGYALAKNIMILIPVGDTNISEAIPFLIIFLILLILLVVNLLKNLEIVKNNWRNSLPLFFVALYPYFWIIAIQNHSTIHATFWVFRIQLAAVFGLLCTYFYLVGKYNSIGRKDEVYGSKS